MKKQATNNFKVDIEGFVTEYLKLPILYHTIAEKDLSKLGFIGIYNSLVKTELSAVARYFKHIID